MAAAAAAASAAARLRLADYDCVGFDMDHTLCRYHLGPFLDMEYRILTDYLIKEKGYGAELRRPLSSCVDFLFKGLVLDVDRGNLLKLAPDGTILRATHGSRLMTEGELSSVYGPRHSNDLLRQFVHTLADCEAGHIQRHFRPLKDYFDMPAAVISANIVDILDRRNGCKPLPKYSFWKDILAGLVDMFSRENLALNVGGYYPAMKHRPKRFIQPCSDQLRNWLDEVHRRQVTYMISGSDPEYVDHIATVTLGSQWRSYFDFIVCGAKKPSFWSGQRPFTQTILHSKADVNGTATTEIPLDAFLKPQRLTPNSVYVAGNWQQLRLSMAHYMDKKRPKCLYFGDHLIQDVLAADRHAHVDAVAIVEELSAEGTGLDDYPPHPHADFLNSKLWGSFFYHDGHAWCSSGGVSGPSRINTLWASIIRHHSRLAVADLETLSRYPLAHRFQPLNHRCSDGKFVGFFPADPLSLQ